MVFIHHPSMLSIPSLITISSQFYRICFSFYLLFSSTFYLFFKTSIFFTIFGRMLQSIPTILVSMGKKKSTANWMWENLLKFGQIKLKLSQFNCMYGVCNHNNAFRLNCLCERVQLNVHRGNKWIIENKWTWIYSIEYRPAILLLLL